MIKVINLKKVIKLSILIIIFFFLLMKIFSKREVIQTSSNSGNKYKILVDVEESKLYLFENGVMIKEYSCSGGKWSTPSPIRYMDYNFKGKMGRRIWRKLDADLMCHGENSEYMEPYHLVLLVGQVLMDVLE